MVCSVILAGGENKKERMMYGYHSKFVETRPLKKVISNYTYSPTNNPHPRYDCSRVLVLECGHEKGVKASIPVPERARCDECEN